MSILHKTIPCGLVELCMEDFDVILRMDWLHASYASIYCRTRRVKFQIPNEPVFEWEDHDSVVKGRFISYLKAQKLISKGCIYHMIRVRDVSSEVPSLESIHIIKEIPDVFPNNLSSISPEREIDFGINLLPDT